MTLMKQGGQWVVGGEDVPMVNFDAIDGIWVNCVGSVSAWNMPPSSWESSDRDIRLQWKALSGPARCGSARRAYPAHGAH